MVWVTVTCTHSHTNPHAAWIDYWPEQPLPYSRSMCSGALQQDMTLLSDSQYHPLKRTETAYTWQHVNFSPLITPQPFNVSHVKHLGVKYLEVLISLQQSWSHHWDVMEPKCIMALQMLTIDSVWVSGDLFCGWQ